eukprot:2695672-Pleurochrysis_carterae.AAC.1
MLSHDSGCVNSACAGTRGRGLPAISDEPPALTTSQLARYGRQVPVALTLSALCRVCFRLDCVLEMGY